MPANYSIEDLKYWEDQIQEKVEYFGLNCFPQEYEICDHNDMLGYMAYSGMPAHYPHWSYGKSFEKLKTMYDYGVSGLPYEMVINSNPCLAYLMRDNTLCLQVMTMAHVMGHNDFFANNFTFSHTHPELTLEKFKAQAVRVRNYIEDPSIGLERVESFLDSAHALMFNCNRNFAIQKRGEAEARAQLSLELNTRTDLSDEEISKRLNRTPIEPEDDILLFIRDNQPLLEEWQRDILTIVHYTASYFVPQIETKIINEGWASFWHRTIMNSMDVPNDIMLEFFAHHNRVVAPHPGSLNPYYLGVAIWDNILFQEMGVDPASEKQYIAPSLDALQTLYSIRESERDTSFIRRFLSEDLMRSMDIFEYEQKGDKQVIKHVSDEQHWQDVKSMLIKNIGVNGMPVIRIMDGDYEGRRTLYLEHEFEGRELRLEEAEKTLEHLQSLWCHEVMLDTTLERKPVRLVHNGEKFEIKKIETKKSTAKKTEVAEA